MYQLGLILSIRLNVERIDSMPRILCDIDNCAYNEGKICRASIVNVAGQNAVTTGATCCATFLSRLGYSNVNLDYGTSRGDTDAIICDVSTCAYNASQHCCLNEIEVSSLTDVDNYTETDCLSFERR